MDLFPVAILLWNSVSWLLHVIKIETETIITGYAFLVYENEHFANVLDVTSFSLLKNNLD